MLALAILSPLSLDNGLARTPPLGWMTWQVSAFVATAFGGLPLQVLSWTRLPYLCSGDLTQTHYYLDNALFVLRKTEMAAMKAATKADAALGANGAPALRAANACAMGRGRGR